MRAIVVGTGIAGLASAIRLSAKGYEVSMYESNPYAGGKLSAFEIDGFAFDAGPSLFTMPGYVDELFRLAGKNPRDHFQYERLELACRYFFPDGKMLNGYADPQRFAGEIEAVLGVPAKVVDTYFKEAERKYRQTKGVFLERSLHKLSTYLTRETLVGVANLWRLGIFSSLNEVNEKHFKEPHLVQLFNRYATYNGSNPYTTPGIMSLIPHLEHGIGAAYPKGGMISIANSLVELAEEMGIQIHLGTPVEEILVEGKQAKGVVVKGETLRSDVVVCNVDVVPAYRHLLKSQKAPEKVLNYERSSSAMIFYWGMDRKFSDLDLHNIFFSADYAEEFKHIFETGGVTEDPTVYINITSKHDPAHAPKGGENWFVMVNVPCNKGQDWEELRRRIRGDVLAKLSRMMEGIPREELEQAIVVEDYLDPPRIEQRTGSFRGALYGAASNDRFAAFLRHANFSRRIGNLYFCGGSVHPGGGIPLCLLSAGIVSDLAPNPPEPGA